MIFGTIKNNKTILAAATTTEELKIFGKALIEKNVLCQNAFEPDLIKLLQDDDLTGLSLAYVFEHKNHDEAIQFSNHYNVNIIDITELRSKHHEMLGSQGKDIDPYSAGADNRTIGDIYDLSQTDPWDSRSEEEKIADAQAKEKADKKKKSGNLTGESFSANPNKLISVTDVHMEKDSVTGEITIERAIAVKLNEEIVEEEKIITIGGKIIDFNGSNALITTNMDISSYPYDQRFYVITSNFFKHAFMKFDKFNGMRRHTDSGACILESTKGWAIMACPDDAAKLDYYIKLFTETTNVYVVNKDGNLLVEPTNDFEISKQDFLNIISHEHGIYYISRISNKHIAETSILGEIVEVLKNTQLYHKLNSIGINNGAWITSRNLMSLLTMNAELNKRGYETSKPDTIDKDNDVILEGDAASVIDLTEKPKQEPRPWNGRMEEFLALGDGDIEKAWRKVKGKELVYCTLPISRHDGVLVYITPAEYWENNKNLWDGVLHIDHLLPSDLKPIEDSLNTWRSRSREELKISHSLIDKGLGEPMLFNLFINNL